MSDPVTPCTGCRWYDPNRFSEPERAKHYGWCGWPLPDLPLFAYMRSQAFTMNTCRLVNKLFDYPEGATCPVREESP